MGKLLSFRKTMKSYEHLDLLLGQALECMDEAAGEVKALSVINQKEWLKHIGRSIVELWELRDAIYEKKPELKRDFVTEFSNDKQRYEDLHIIYRKAAEAEDSGDFDTAINHYKELLETSKFGFFKLIAEAGLYRSINKIDGGQT